MCGLNTGHLTPLHSLLFRLNEFFQRLLGDYQDVYRMYSLKLCFTDLDFQCDAPSTLLVLVLCWRFLS